MQNSWPGRKIARVAAKVGGYGRLSAFGMQP